MIMDPLISIQIELTFTPELSKSFNTFLMMLGGWLSQMVEHTSVRSLVRRFSLRFHATSLQVQVSIFSQ